MSSNTAWVLFTVVVWFLCVLWICTPSRGDD